MTGHYVVKQLTHQVDRTFGGTIHQLTKKTKVVAIADGGAHLKGVRHAGVLRGREERKGERGIGKGERGEWERHQK